MIFKCSIPPKNPGVGSGRDCFRVAESRGFHVFLDPLRSFVLEVNGLNGRIGLRAGDDGVENDGTRDGDIENDGIGDDGARDRGAGDDGAGENSLESQSMRGLFPAVEIAPSNFGGVRSSKSDGDAA